MAIKSDIERYRMNFRAEQEGALLYRELAKAEADTHLADRHCSTGGNALRATVLGRALGLFALA